MTTRYVAAVDQGTTSTRCIVFDRAGRMVSVAQQEHRQHYPRAGWVEHDAAEIWAMAQRVIRQALADARVDRSQLVGLGITNQRETTVLWDRNSGEPVHNAIVWQDTRTTDVLAEAARTLSASQIQAKSGLPLVNYFSASKISWLLSRDEKLRRRAEAGDVLFGTMDSWLVWNLTGGSSGGRHVTDVTNASRTMLMNLATLDWDDDLLNCFTIPRNMLPEIVPTVGQVGVTASPIDGVPVTAMVGDQQASLLGQTAFDSGDAKCTFGTGTFLLRNTGPDIVRSSHGLITTVAHKFAGEDAVYALEGSVAVAGALVQWCRELGLIRSAAEIETLASSVPDSAGCYIVPAFAGLFAPYWVPEARGMLVGLTSYVTKAHLCRAVLEATAWQTRDVVAAMDADVGQPITKLRVDGGMTANNLLMQKVADVLDVPVVRPVLSETVAVGAAYAAGLGAGFWPDRSALRGNWRQAAEWTPQLDPRIREEQYAGWRKAISFAIAWGVDGPQP